MSFHFCQLLAAMSLSWRHECRDSAHARRAHADASGDGPTMAEVLAPCSTAHEMNFDSCVVPHDLSPGHCATTHAFIRHRVTAFAILRLLSQCRRLNLRYFARRRCFCADIDMPPASLAAGYYWHIDELRRARFSASASTICLWLSRLRGFF